MPKVNLRQSFIEHPPKPTDKPKTDYFDTQLTGLLLEVTRNGQATFYLRYRDKSARIRQVRIGKVDSMSLEEARERAKKLKSQVLMGFDPMQHAEKIKQIPTFKEFVYQQYIPHAKAHKRSWKYDQQIIEQKLLQLWGKKRMDEFKPGDILEFQNNLAAQDLKPGTVNRYVTLVKYVFNLAERWEVIDRAPTRNVERLQDNDRKERYLTPEELERLMQELDNCNSEVVPEIIRFLILTGARRSEVVNLPWSELELG